MKIALYTGTFDPPTLGHLDLIQRAASLFDSLYVGVASSSDKHSPLLSWEQRQRLLEEMCKSMENVSIVAIEGLAIDCASACKAQYLVRGLRSTADFAYEYQMACSNHQMTNIETVLLFSSPAYAHLSSGLVRQIALQKKSLKGFVPVLVEKALSSADPMQQR